MKYANKQLAKVFGEEDAKTLRKLTSNYDKYILKFKTAISPILEAKGYEVKVGVAFVKKESSKK